jgi:hypothetical protein
MFVFILWDAITPADEFKHPIRAQGKGRCPAHGDRWISDDVGATFMIRSKQQSKRFILLIRARQVECDERPGKE